VTLVITGITYIPRYSCTLFKNVARALIVLGCKITWVESTTALRTEYSNSQLDVTCACSFCVAFCCVPGLPERQREDYAVQLPELTCQLAKPPKNFRVNRPNDVRRCDAASKLSLFQKTITPVSDSKHT
jgi:hypothetical protein